MDSTLFVLSALLSIFLFSHEVEGVRLAKRQSAYYQPQYIQAQPHYLTQTRPLYQKEKEEHQDLSKVPGVPGVDYPVYHSVPDTSFDCSHVPAVPGMYANVETGCQAYHVCHDGREGHQGASFLCTNGTLFNQKEFTCDWWYNVDCHQAPQFYSLNLDPVKNPYAPKPKQPEILDPYGPIPVHH